MIIEDLLNIYFETGIVKQELIENIDYVEQTWKPVIDSKLGKTNYSVSNLGFVRNDLTLTILKPFYRRLYLVVKLCKNTNERTVSVHRLVATAFVEGRTELRNEVDHVDGVKEHNYASNLEWVSRSEQILRAYKLGLIKPILGEDKDNAVYSNEFIIKLCGYMELGMSSPELAEHMGVEKTKSFQWLVDGIRSKNRWVFISRNFNIPRFKEERNIWVEPIVRDTAYKISKNVPRDIIFGFLYGLFTHRSEKCINTFIDDIQFKRRYTEITDEYF